MRGGGIAATALIVLMLAYGLMAGSLALRRHWNLESQALDMGYADQVTWNMTQGRLYRFTPFRGIVGSELGRALEYGPGADRDSLFAYHVELLYLPLSALYLVLPGAEALIVFLTTAMALGAVPVYALAYRVLQQRAAALCFAAVYLLTPAVQAANLSDFHLVSASPVFLTSTLYALLARRYRLFILGAVLSAFLKEEVGLLVAAMGGYLCLTAKDRASRTVGIAVGVGALAWVTLCLLVIMPHFTGGAPSLFAARYGDAIRHLRGWPEALMNGRLAWPVPAFTVTYVRELLAGTGFLALLAPLELALAAPVLAINGLSGSTWQHGGGAHYSAEVVPALLLAAAVGVRRASDWLWRHFKVAPARGALALSAVALLCAVWQARTHGVLPPSARFTREWLASNGRLETLRPLLARIPPDAVVSAQSNVYPHLSNREWIYVFPNVDDARYVILDVAGTSDPLYVDDAFPEVQALLANPQFRLLDGAGGFLLFERSGAATGAGVATAPPERFYDFVRPAPNELARGVLPALAQFGDVFELTGYRLMPVPEVNFGIRRSTITLYVRARRPAERALRVTAFRLGADNLARIHDDGNPMQLWQPAATWRAGETLKLTYPPITALAGERLGIGAQIGIAEGVPRLTVTSATHPVVDGGRVVVLGHLP